MIVIHIILVIFFTIAAFSTAYVFFFAIAGLFYKAPTYNHTAPKSYRRIALMIPAYKEDTVIIDSAKYALQQNYPTDQIDVIVIADSFKPETLQTLRAMTITVEEVSFENSTKAIALHTVLQRTQKVYDIALIVDADNILENDFALKVNACFEQGWKVLQAYRTAKNTNTSTAVLDSVSEELNNYILRRAHRAVNLSSGLIGSGMAFDYTLLRNLVSEIYISGGLNEDKALEMSLLKRDIKIEFLSNALCYDEKVQNPMIFEKQRTRWIAAQVTALKTDLIPGLLSVFKGNWDYFDKALQTLLIPRVILLGLLTIGILLSLILQDLPLAILTTSQLIILLFSFYIIIPKFLKEKIGWRELKEIPNLFLRFLRGVTRMYKSKGRFLHTPHTIVGKDQINH